MPAGHGNTNRFLHVLVVPSAWAPQMSSHADRVVCRICPNHYYLEIDRFAAKRSRSSTANVITEILAFTTNPLQRSERLNYAEQRSGFGLNECLEWVATNRSGNPKR